MSASSMLVCGRSRVAALLGRGATEEGRDATRLSAAERGRIAALPLTSGSGMWERTRRTRNRSPSRAEYIIILPGT